MIALLLNYIVHRSQQIVINENVDEIIITRKRSLRRLCFHRCLSVHRGSRSLSRGVSVQEWVSVQVGLCPGRVSVQGVSVWQGLCQGRISIQGVGVCPGGVSVQGGFCLGALWQDLCPGGLCPGRISVQGVGLFPGVVSVQGGSLSGGVVWSTGVSVQGGSLSGGGGEPQYGNVRAVRILLECILVQDYFWCII